MPTLPIPIYTSARIGSMRSRDGETFTMYAGLEIDQVAQLRAYSLDETDEEIQKNTSDRQRFGEGSYEKWYAKGRVPFALVHDATGTLAAITWFGPKPLGRKSLKHLSEEERHRMSGPGCRGLAHGRLSRLRSIPREGAHENIFEIYDGCISHRIFALKNMGGHLCGKSREPRTRRKARIQDA